MRTRSPFRLVTLDLDGTMFRENAVLYLEKKGLLDKEVKRLHLLYDAFKISESEMNRLQARELKKPRLSPLFRALTSGPLLKNIDKGVDMLRKQGLMVSMLTMDPLQIFFKKEYGIDVSISYHSTIKRDHFSEIDEFPNDKHEYLLKYCDQQGIDPSQIVHIGDGRSDLETFDVVGFSMALNSTLEELKKKADYSLAADDFSVVAKMLLKKI